MPLREIRSWFVDEARQVVPMAHFTDYHEHAASKPSSLVESLRHGLIHLSLERDGLGRVDAVKVMRKRVYTLCLGAKFDIGDRVVLGWSGFLDSSKMMGSESWEVFGVGASIWGRY